MHLPNMISFGSITVFTDQFKPATTRTPNYHYTHTHTHTHMHIASNGLCHKFHSVS